MMQLVSSVAHSKVPSSVREHALNSLALLMFNRNQNEEIIRNVNMLKDIVDEVVIIDSSSTEFYERLKLATESLPCKIYHVLPIGFPEPLRMYGLSKVKSDYVLLLDANEIPSSELAQHLRSLNVYDAYRVCVKDPDGYEIRKMRATNNSSHL